MLKPLYERLIKEHDVFITARDFDSTIYLLEKWGVDYIKAGKYGGNQLIGKLRSYSERIHILINIIEEQKPDFLFCITSPEALRISFGLQIPNIMFNDEPRSYGPCTTTFPYVDQIIVPKCIPLEWYLDYGLKKEKIIRFNGIDEVGWLSDFKPDESYLDELNLTKMQYIICRTEPSQAGYLTNKLEPHETRLVEIIPKIIEYSSDFKFIVLSRNEKQYTYLNKRFKKYIENENLAVYKGLENLAHLMFFSKLVISGGGTMVRESALLGVPSIEFFPLNTYPQEQFLIDNGFPLRHLKNLKDIVIESLNWMESDFNFDTLKKIKELENPIEIGIREFKKRK
ncbi:MAG: DUF354 domain-containing protein [Promethearchaeota archaeon]|nr:MAG: DUF354 domain-containing protein [Candidatus Lokiarchaeota archaeon]